MLSIRAIFSVCVVTSFFNLLQPAVGETYPLILRGKVTMQDGSAPPKSVGIQRICSGPLTDKKGEYIWRMDVDPMRTRICRLETSLPGYASSSVDISALNGYNNTSVTLAPIVLTASADDPYVIITSENGLPSKGAAAWKAAIKAIDAGNLPEAQKQMEATVKAAPKFEPGWHALGVVYEQLGMAAEARSAWEHAIESDPKVLAPYMTLTRACIRAKDWQCAAKSAEGLIKADTKHTFPAIYLHQAVARYGLKDLGGAESSVREAIRLDPGHRSPRAEYVLGRILEAKGDLSGAREHITGYLSLEPNAGDLELVKAHLQFLGKPEAATVEPELELL